MQEHTQTEMLFFACLRSAVTGEPLGREMCALLNDARQHAVYRLAKKHDVAHLIAYVFQKEALPMSEQAMQTLHRTHMAAIYRMQLLLREQERIGDTLEQAGIPHALLKGAVLREFYPEVWMRTSCDIDILTPREKVEEATELLAKMLDYRVGKTVDHDVQIFAPNGTHLELHFTLCVNHPSHDVLLERAWEYATPVEGKTAKRELDFAFHLCYFLAHAAKHVLNGGCGVRPFLDLFVLRKGNCYDEQKLLSFCEQAGLVPFYRACCSLCDVWFSAKTPTEEDRAFADYLLGAGVYGNTENLVTVSNVRNGGFFGYLRMRLFPPASSIYTLYPNARCHRALLPFYYVRRLFRVFLPDRRKASVEQWNYARAVTKQASKNTAELLSRLGL